MSRSTVSTSAFGLVRHVRRDAEHFARVNDDFFTVDPELQRAVENVRELLVVVAVLGDNASLLQQHAGRHDFLPDHELPLQQRVEVFERDSVPGDVLQSGGPGDGARLARRRVLF